nr:transketolase [Streptomyces lonarensis]
MARMTGADKHAPAADSLTDALWVLHQDVLRLDPARPDAEDRDRFLLSRGHGPMSYYAVLAARGFLDPAVLDGFGTFDSPLGHHPDRTLVPGVEISSGSLGHGLPIGVGTALGLRARGLAEQRVWVMVGDAELDEGSNHEALEFAGAYGLDSLHLVVVDNSSATWGDSRSRAERITAAGWSLAEADGRDHADLRRAYTLPHPGRPHAVLARVEPKHAR